MQKTDFISYINNISNRLKSRTIVSMFEAGFNNPSNLYDYSKITPLLFETKSSYDVLSEETQYKEIFNALNASGIYNATNLSHLSQQLEEDIARNVLGNALVIRLYNFHKAILSNANLTNSVLGNSEIEESLENESNNGVIVFQVVIGEDFLPITGYVEILGYLNEIIQILTEIYEEEDGKVILLDSGSDTNVGIKAGIETVNSLFEIFKTTLEFTFNHKHYKLKKDSETLLGSLEVIEKVDEKVKNGTITGEQGDKYKHLIKSRTDKLIGLNVVPKQFLIESGERKELLLKQRELKLLESGE